MTKFGQLKIGDIFLYEGKRYIKAKPVKGSSCKSCKSGKESYNAHLSGNKKVNLLLPPNTDVEKIN